MIRLVHCVKRLPELSVAEFRKYWKSAEFVERLGRLAKITGAQRTERNLTLLIEMNLRLMEERGSGEPFDAILEIWWESAGEFSDKLESPEFQQTFQEMEEFQRRFIDFTISRRFFTEWESDAGEV